jgi:putative ABC transport system permease protein
LGNQFSTILFRKSLVVFQFVITIVMIAGSLHHLPAAKLFPETDLGFNKAQTLTFHINNRDVRGKVML